MFNRLGLLAAGASAAVMLGCICSPPAAHAHGADDGHDPHQHHRTGKQKAFNRGYRRGYRQAQKHDYRIDRAAYRPTIRPVHPVVIRPYRVAPHRSWVSVGLRFPL